jgi:hypothetical protein
MDDIDDQDTLGRSLAFMSAIFDCSRINEKNTSKEHL